MTQNLINIKDCGSDCNWRKLNPNILYLYRYIIISDWGIWIDKTSVENIDHNLARICAVKVKEGMFKGIYVKFGYKIY
jgi:hypothetical protein